MCIRDRWSAAARRHQSAGHRAFVLAIIIAFATGAVLRLGFFNLEETGRSAAENREAKS